MKIIAGNYGGRNIKTLTTYDTRPTSAKVRGAIFNALGQYFVSGNVLDIFSGSGAMAIEAISRGCVRADCVDNNRDACKIIEENKQSLNLGASLNVFCMDYSIFLKKATQKYDLIFIDPPYKMQIMEEILEIIFQRELLAQHGKIILEFSNKIYTDTSFLSAYQVVFNRSYVATQVVIIEASC